MATQDLDAVHKELKKMNERLEQLVLEFAEMRGRRAGLLWVCRLVGMMVAAVFVGEAVGWLVAAAIRQ